MLLEVLEAGEDAFVKVVEADTFEATEAVDTVVANGELTADVPEGLRHVSLLGVANIKSSVLTPPLLGPGLPAPKFGTEVGPLPFPPPEDSTRSLFKLWSCTLGEVEETSVRPLVDESGGELMWSIGPPMGPPIVPPAPPGGPGGKPPGPPRLLLLELLS